MTDTEIINAAEEFVRRLCELKCEMHNCECCMVTCVKQTIELARSQKAELEKRQEETNKKRLVLMVKLDEEKMEQIKKYCLEGVEYNIKEIQSEAIEGFAEQVEEALLNKKLICREDIPIIIKKIVKEAEVASANRVFIYG